MKDVKTRPKTRDIKLRDSALLTPRELSYMMKESAKARILHEQPKTEENRFAAESSSVSGVINGIEGDTQGAVTYMARKSFSGGKRLAQKQYDSRFCAAKTADQEKQADYSDGNSQPVSSKAAQEYRKEKAKQTQEKNHEIKVKSDVLVSGGAPSPQNLKTKVETSDTSVHKLAAETKKAYTQRAKARAVREMQREMEKNAAEKVAGTGKTVARGISRIKQAVERTGKAIIKAFVGFLGGAGGLITLVLIIGGAAAIIATPFGVFWSGQDESTMTMPMAVAQINAEYEAKLSRIENENHADSNVGCFIFPLYPKIPQKSYTYCVGSEPFIILSVFRTDDIILSFFSLVLSHNLRMGFYLSTQFCDQTSFGVESIMLDFVLQFRIDYKGTANWVENCFQKCSAQSGTMAPLISLIEFVNKNKKEPLFLMNRGSPSRADIMVKAFVCNAG